MERTEDPLRVLWNMTTAASLNATTSPNNSTTNGTGCGLIPHQYLEVKFYLISVIGGIITAFGLFGNLTTAFILTRPSMRSPNNLYLTTLAVFDSCLLISAFLIYSIEYITETLPSLDLYVVWLTYLPFMFGFSHISQTGSVYITVAVTLERLVALLFPRRSRQYCTRNGASLSILLVTCFAILFNCTKFFEIAIIKNPACPIEDFQSYQLTVAAIANNEFYQFYFSLWISNFVMVFLPFITLAVVNSVIAYQMRKTLRRMRWAGARLSRHSKLKAKSREDTIVLIFIVITFLVCNIWGFLLTSAEIIYTARYLSENHHTGYTFTREAINFLTIINSSVNFVIYCIFGRDFRRELVTFYACGIRNIYFMVPAQDKFSVWRYRKKASLTNEISLRHFQGDNYGKKSTAVGKHHLGCKSRKRTEYEVTPEDQFSNVALRQFHGALATRFGGSENQLDGMEENVAKKGKLSLRTSRSCGDNSEVARLGGGGGGNIADQNNLLVFGDNEYYRVQRGAGEQIFGIGPAPGSPWMEREKAKPSNGKTNQHLLVKVQVNGLEL